MDTERDQVLRQLSEAAEKGMHAEEFFQSLHRAQRDGPLPEQFLKELMQKRARAGSGKTPMSTEKEHKLREALGRIYGPSRRALDPSDPVGAAGKAIRAKLSGFVSWQVDWATLDVSKMIQDISDGDEKALSFMLPAGFEEPSSGSYACAIRTSLIQDEDGSVCMPFEFMQSKASVDAAMRQIRRGKRLSDTLSLLLKEAGTLELDSIEKLLADLTEAIMPDVPTRFRSYPDPRHRAALRMDLGDNAIPAAAGGVLRSLSGLPDGFCAASIQIFLEPWAAARSGEIVELAEFPSVASLKNGRRGN